VLGAVGCVSDAGLRDVKEVEALGGFQYFCPGFVVSHGQPVILDVNVPVEIHGLPIVPGDLLHGDVNGLLVVPEVIAAEVAGACDAVRAEERALLDLITAPGFSVEKLRQWKLTH
jgi:4-hydroxy-4-methyl-2-oxoglutarate aldolase